MGKVFDAVEIRRLAEGKRAQAAQLREQAVALETSAATLFELLGEQLPSTTSPSFKKVEAFLKDSEEQPTTPLLHGLRRGRIAPNTWPPMIVEILSSSPNPIDREGLIGEMMQRKPGIKRTSVRAAINSLIKKGSIEIGPREVVTLPNSFTKAAGGGE